MESKTSRLLYLRMLLELNCMAFVSSGLVDQQFAVFLQATQHLTDAHNRTIGPRTNKPTAL